MRENDQEVGRCLQKGGEVITDQDSKIQSWKILGKGKDNDLEITHVYLWRIHFDIWQN